VKVALGLGCDRGTPAETIERAIAQALARAGVTEADVSAVATIDRKADEPGMIEVCRRHGWTLVCYPAERLREVAVPNPSPVVMRHVGTPSVGEAAAILCAGADQGALLVEKQKWRGEDGRHATVSVCACKERR